MRKQGKLVGNLLHASCGHPLTIFMESNAIDHIRLLFDLPTLKFTEDVPGSFFLRYCNASSKFIVLVVTNRAGEFLFVPAIIGTHSWQLPGRRLRDGETMDACLSEMLSTYGLNPCQTQPLAVAEQTFRWENREIRHRGLVVLVRTASNQCAAESGLLSVSSPELPYQNSEFVALAKERLQSSQIDLPFNEIESAEGAGLAYAVHRGIVKPIMRRSSMTLLRQIVSIADKIRPRSILDVSCGDDWTIQALADRDGVELAVANDVTREMMPCYRRNVFSSNQSLLDARFGLPFDLVLCKNTLHHVPREAHADVLRKLCSLGKSALVVDVVSPEHSTWQSRMWNAYYRRFLDDQGHDFLTPAELAEAVNEADLSSLENGVIKTARGEYMYSLISPSSHGR